MDYHEESFWAGVALGKQLKGWGTYGRPEGFDPDGDLILRPITQGVGRINFGPDIPFAIRAIVDSVESSFPEQELPGLTQEVGRISFGSAGEFAIRAINERLVVDEVLQSWSIDETINPLDYDESIVYINSSGAFTMRTAYTEYSTASDIDSGKLQVLKVDTDRFESIEEQEVSLC